MSVTVSGRSGLTNAYTSVESATGSLVISGASRCDDIPNLTAIVGVRRLLGHLEVPQQLPDEGGVAEPDLAVAGEDVHLAVGGVREVHHERAGPGRSPVRWPDLREFGEA